eukprot:11172833-Ditylum_brightwellii.AAC.1
MREVATILIQKEYVTFVKCKATCKQNKTCTCTIAYGQCSKAMRAKLQSKEKFRIAAEESDIVLLLKLIKKISYQ